MSKNRGIALVVALLGALVLLIVVIAVVSSLSLSNRKISGNKSVELEAQYAAESGAEQSEALLKSARNLLQHVSVDMGRTGAKKSFAKALYAFCHGSTSVPYKELLKIVEAIDPSSGKTYTCKANARKLKADLRTKSEEELGKTWMRLLTRFIDPSYYTAKGIRHPAKFWGRVLSGNSTMLSRTLRRSPDQVVIYRLSSGLAGFTPLKAQVGKGRAVFRFGDPSAGTALLYSVGEVRSPSGKVIASRKVQVGNESESLLAFDLFAPNYAWYAYFVDQQPKDWETNPRKMVVFTDQNVIDGPVHFNDYIAFEEGSSPWFGGPVTSAGPALHKGQGPRIYWRNSTSGSTGYDEPPAGVDGEHWWRFDHAAPEFAIKRDALGNPVCYNPTTREEKSCLLVDNDGDGKPDSPWVPARDVNLDHAKVPLPGAREVDAVRREALSNGIYIDGSKFQWLNPNIERKLGDPPPNELIGIYLNYRANKGVILEAQGDTQLITIYAERVAGFTEHPYWKITRTYDCPPPPPPGGGGGPPPPPPPPPSGGGTVLAPFDLVFPAAFAQGAGSGYCASIKKPRCRSGCKCDYECKKLYTIVKKEEKITLKYSKKDRTLHVVSKDGDLDFLQLPTGDFNGIIFSDIGEFGVEGPGRKPDGTPKPAIAAFAQLTVASSGSVMIKNDVTYAKPACTKIPHRDTTDQDGDGDTREVVDRCRPEDFKDASPNVFGIFAKDIEFYPHYRGLDLNVHGVLMAYGGEVKTWNVRHQGDWGKFKLFGGIIQKRIGPIGYIDNRGRFHGYHTSASYDRRMLHGLAPPGFLPFGNGVWSSKPAEKKAGNRGFWRQVPGN